MPDADGPVPREMVAAVPSIRADPLRYLQRVVAALLRDHAVDPVPGHRVEVDTPVTLRPRGGLPLRLRRPVPAS